MNTPQQCVFDFGAPPVNTFERFVTGDNALPLVLVKQLGTPHGEAQLYLWGDAGSGKTHLLQAACEHLGRMGQPAAYVALCDAKHPELLEGLESMALVAVDDVQCAAGEPVWEMALFDLINRLREAHTPLLLGARHPPAVLGVHLPDLASRLHWGAVLRLETLDEASKREVLRRHAAERGMELPDEVIYFMFAHLPRGLSSLLAGLEQLDRASMERQRRLTLPLAREVLG